MVAVGALVGVALFGAQDVAVLSGGTITPAGSAGRALLAAGYVTVSLVGLGTIGLFVSTLTDVPVGAMAATVTLAVVAQVLGQIPQIDWLHPWLFTYRWFDVADVLRDPVVVGVVPAQRRAAGRVRARVRGAGLGPVHHQGRPQLRSACRRLRRGRPSSPSP